MTNWSVPANALVARVLQSDIYFASQGVIAPALRSAPASPGAVLSSAYAVGGFHTLNADGGNFTACTLNITIPNATVIAVDAFFNASTGGNSSGAEVDFTCQVDGAAINDNGTGRPLTNDDIDFALVTGNDASQNIGGVYARQARIIGLTVGPHVLTLIAKCPAFSPNGINLDKPSIRAYLMTA